MRMPDKTEEHSAQTMDPRDERGEERRPTRMPSPHMNETSKYAAAEQRTNITNISPELLAHITETVTKEVVEKLRHVSSFDTTKAEPPKDEPLRTSSHTADQSKTEPIERINSPDKSTSSPSPPLSAQGVYTPPSPNWGSKSVTNNNDSPPLSPIRSPPGSPTKEKSSVRFTNPRGPIDKEAVRNVRPQAYRSFSNAELSTVDQKWGKLFDNDRKPTARLGQFLRGLANHIILELEPKNSLVIGPLKMAAFYANHPLEEEAFPFVSIFKSQSNGHLSELYQDLACQHHLIQEENYKDPLIPALTPIGFAHWMTKWILAYPEQEAARLEKVVCSLPIDADGQPVDGKPERLPKQISRHLLPGKEDLDLRKELKEAIEDFLDDLGMPRKRQISIASPPLSRRTSSTQPAPLKTRPIDIPQPKSSSKNLDRDRAVHSSTSSEASAIDDTLPIERDRQPYVAQPGNGRVFTEGLGVPQTTGRERANSASRVIRGPELEQQKHYRTQSTASSNPYIPGPRPGGSRRQQSPPIQKFSNSNPLSLDTSGNYTPETFSSPPKHAHTFSQPLYTPSSAKGLSPLHTDARDRDRERDSDRDRDRERDQERERDNRERHTTSRRYDRDSRRKTLDEFPSRRNTISESSRIPPDLSSPRDPDRRDRLHEERDRERERERDKMYEPKSADPRHERGPILHQDFRPEARSALPDEEYYRSALPRGEYESGQSKYFPRYRE